MSALLQLEGIIPDESAGLRLDQALAQLFPDYSRGQLTKWIKSGDVSVDTNQLRPRDSVSGGETIIITAQIEVVDDTWIAEAIQLDIIHEDDEVIILNKPAGMVVHPGAGNHDGTLVNALLHHCPQLEAIPRAGIVHRIDKDTSGLLVVAKTEQAMAKLSLQFAEKTSEREYMALVWGNVEEDSGTIE
ncbi:MAG: pseudouridine synthase, partial [Candidatus Thioglobus sp.]